MTDRPPHKGYPGTMKIVLHGGPFNGTQVPDRGQGQIICNLPMRDYVAQSIYEIFPGRRSEGFFLTNEYIQLPHE